MIRGVRVGGAGLATCLEGRLASLGTRAVSTRSAYVGDVAEFARRLHSHDPSRVPAEAAAWLAQGRVLSARSGVRLATLMRGAHALALLEVGDLDRGRVEEILLSLADTSAPSSAQRQVSAFASFLDHLLEVGVLVESPLEAPMRHLERFTRSEHDALSEAEELALYRASDEGSGDRLTWSARDVAAMRLLFAAGAGASSARSARRTSTRRALW